MSERPWRMTADEMMRSITEPWPPPSVAALFERLGVEDAQDWARPFGSDFIGAWSACPRESWLFGLAIVAAAGAGDEDVARALIALTDAPPHQGFGHSLPVPREGSAERIRAAVDGPLLLQRAGLG